MTILSLYDESGNALVPWARAGYKCVAVDILNKDNLIVYPSGGSIFFKNLEISDIKMQLLINMYSPNFVMGFPPCTDLAVSGAAHFSAKRQVDPLFQDKALELAALIPRYLDCPWFFENPVSVLSTMYRKPDHSFHPYEYGAYLPENDVHPRWPDHIPARDAYPKKTCIWSGNGFVMPEKRPVPVPDGYSKAYLKLGGKSAKTKQIRSEGPRGFLWAVYEANHDRIPIN